MRNKYKRFDLTKYYIEELYHLPRVFFAWIILHIASWLSMELIVATDDISEQDVDDMWQDIIEGVDAEEFDLSKFDELGMDDNIFIEEDEPKS